MSLRWLGVAFVLFAGGWGVGLTSLPVFGEVGVSLLAVWCFGAFAGSYVTCRCSPSIRIREATGGALVMAALMAGAHTLFPRLDLFTPPEVLGSWAAVAAVVFAAGLAGAWLGSRPVRHGARRPPGRLEAAMLGALALVGAMVVIALLYAFTIFAIPSFAVAFIFMFALLGAPAAAGVIAVIALGERGRMAIIGGAAGLGAWSWVLVIAAQVLDPPLVLGPIIVSCMAFALTALLVGLIGVAGVELAERRGWGPQKTVELPRAAVRG